MNGALVAIGTRSGTVFVYHLNGKWKDQVSKPKNSYLVNTKTTIPRRVGEQHVSVYIHHYSPHLPLRG